MCTPSGNSEFCFPSSLNVSLDFVSGTLRLSGKQNSLFPSGAHIKYISPAMQNFKLLSLFISLEINCFHSQ